MINNLKELRLKRELTLRGLSKEVEIPTSTLSKYETGNRILIGVNLYKLANYFNVSVGFLQGVDIETPSVKLKNDVPTEVIYKGKNYKVVENE